jgi:hypothetical protein
MKYIPNGSFRNLLNLVKEGMPPDFQNELEFTLIVCGFAVGFECTCITI